LLWFVCVLSFVRLLVRLAQGKRVEVEAKRNIATQKKARRREQKRKVGKVL